MPKQTINPKPGDRICLKLRPATCGAFITAKTIQDRTYFVVATKVINGLVKETMMQNADMWRMADDDK